jgi:hypothetical protein
LNAVGDISLCDPEIKISKLILFLPWKTPVNRFLAEKLIVPEPVRKYCSFM